MRLSYYVSILLFFGSSQLFGQAPTLNCTADVNENADAGICGTNVTYTIPTCADNCSGTTVSQTDATGLTSGDFFPVGTTTLEYTVSSMNGSNTCSFDVTVWDVTPPAITCPNDETIYSNNLCKAFVPDYSSSVIITEECDLAGVIFNQVPSAGTNISGLSTQVITLSVTDTSKNESTCTFTLTISDTISPSLSCPVDQNVSPTTGCEATLGNYTGVAITSDNCTANPIVTQNPNPGTSISSSQLVTLTSTDDAGNSTSCSFTVIVDDVTAPDITCPNDQTDYVNSSCDFIVPDYSGLLTITDNCDQSPTIQQIPSAGATINGTGSQFISFSVTDIANNVSFCSFTLTLEDTLGPNLTCPSDFDVYLDNNCEYTLLDYSSLVTAADNCTGAAFLSQQPTIGTTITPPDSPIEILITGQDILGNTSSCSFKLTLVDTIAPSIVQCLNDTIIEADLNCRYIIGDFTSLVDGTDNCSSSFTITQSLTVGDTLLAGGPYPAVVFLTDDQGNVDSCNFTIEVKDITPPALTCPLNPSVPANSSCAYTIPAYDTTLNITDNCSGFTYTQSMAAGTIISGIGTQQAISIFVNDAAGNSNSCSFTITVVDTTAPSLTCPSDQTLDINSVCQYDLIDFTGLALVSDFCDATPVLSQNPGIGVTMSGINVITISAEDASGNTSTCTFNVSPNDTVSPTIACPSNISSCNDLVSYIEPIGVDDCVSATTLQSDITGYTSGSNFPEGTTTIEYTVTDAVGNSSACSFDITIHPQVTINPGSSTTIDEGESVTIDATISNANSIEWSPDYNIDSIDIQSPTVNPGVTTYYVVQATSDSGCTAIDSLLIIVNTIDSLIVNNFFSPNGDQSNETWNVNKPALISGCWVTIYNRWGRKVWESNSYENQWNGINMNGEPLPEGTYFYVISCASGEPVKGSVLLMR